MSTLNSSIVVELQRYEYLEEFNDESEEIEPDTRLLKSNHG